MKTEELLNRAIYDHEHRWKCAKCGNPLTTTDILTWGEWSKGKRYPRSISRCCDAKIQVRI